MLECFCIKDVFIINHKKYGLYGFSDKNHPQSILTFPSLNEKILSSRLHHLLLSRFPFFVLPPMPDIIINYILEIHQKAKLEAQSLVSCKTLILSLKSLLVLSQVIQKDLFFLVTTLSNSYKTEEIISDNPIRKPMKK
jgi:hypothetical protein